MLVVADAGPLIHLSSIDRLELLRELFDRTVIPSCVFEEAVERGAGLPGSKEVAAAHWLEIATVDTSDLLFRSLLTVLDVGEAGSIALARRMNAELVLIDERRGRAAARGLGLRVQGTLGLLVRGRHAGLVDAVAPLLQGLLAAGFWMSDDLRQLVLAAVGEAWPGED